MSDGGIHGEIKQGGISQIEEKQKNIIILIQPIVALQIYTLICIKGGQR